MVETLNIQTVVTDFNTPSQSFPSGPNFQVNIPQSSVTVVKPISYQFRVAEYVDLEGKVVKVGLQVSVFEHDNFGGRQLRKDWTDVERVQLPFSS